MVLKSDVLGYSFSRTSSFSAPSWIIYRCSRPTHPSATQASLTRQHQVFLQRIRWVASLGYPTLGKDYRANKPVSILSHKMALHWRPHRRDEKYNLKKGSQFLSQSSHTLTGAKEAIIFPLKSSYFFEGCATMLTVLIISRLATIAKTQQRKNVLSTTFYLRQSYSNF